jgi:hypothetical protein
MRNEESDLPDHDAEFAAEFNRDEPSGTPPSAGATSAPPAADTGKKSKTAKKPRQKVGDSHMAEAGQMAHEPMQAGNAAKMAMQHADEAKRLMQMEASLQARARELDSREAAMKRHDGKAGMDKSGAGGMPDDHSTDPASDQADDPMAILSAEFGADFGDLLTRAIIQICQQQIGHGMNSLDAKVESLIAHLSQERQQNHLQTIAASHKDFMEIVDSPAFMEWKSEQDASGQADIARVMEQGSAQEIIAMLTRFKQDQADDDDDDGNATAHASAHDPAMAAAEGVRSSGIRLPKAPSAADDFAAAWNEA